MRGNASYWSLLIVVVIIALAMLFGLWPKDKNFEEVTGLEEVPEWAEVKEKVDKGYQTSKEFIEGEITEAEERIKIENWIIKNNLNQYGDSRDTMYTGGTPLFDERTGETMNKYNYITSRHPDKPWRK